MSCPCQAKPEVVLARRAACRACPYPERHPTRVSPLDGLALVKVCPRSVPPRLLYNLTLDAMSTCPEGRWGE